MEINRNQYFLAGLVFLFLGLQLRMVDSYVLNPKATQALAKQSVENSNAFQQATTMFATKTITPRKVVRPPEWLGWFLCSLGAVLIMHSLAMRRPE